MGQGNPAAALRQSSDNKKKLLAFYQGLCAGTLILHRLGVLKYMSMSYGIHMELSMDMHRYICNCTEKCFVLFKNFLKLVIVPLIF